MEDWEKYYDYFEQIFTLSTTSVQHPSWSLDLCNNKRIWIAVYLFNLKNKLNLVKIEWRCALRSLLFWVYQSFYAPEFLVNAVFSVDAYRTWSISISTSRHTLLHSHFSTFLKCITYGSGAFLNISLHTSNWVQFCKREIKMKPKQKKRAVETSNMM